MRLCWGVDVECESNAYIFGSAAKIDHVLAFAMSDLCSGVVCVSSAPLLHSNVRATRQRRATYLPGNFVSYGCGDVTLAGCVLPRLFVVRYGKRGLGV